MVIDHQNGQYSQSKWSLLLSLCCFLSFMGTWGVDFVHF